MKKRSEIKEQYKWDLSSYYADESQFENDFNYIKNNYKNILKYENKLKNKKNILNCLMLNSDISKKLEKLVVYASLKCKEDVTNAKNNARLNRAEKLAAEVSTALCFISTEIKKLSNKTLDKLSNNEKFENFSLFFKDIIKAKPHILSINEEKILSAISEFAGDFSEVFDMLDSADIKFDNVSDKNGKSLELNNSVYSIYIQSDDAVLRRNAYIGLNSTYGKFNNTLAANYIASLKTDCIGAKLRNFKSALSSSIFYEDSSEEVYKNLINEVNSNLKVFWRYFEIKRKALGVDKLCICDMNANLKSAVKGYNFEAGYELVINALNILGQDYVNTLKRAKNERWIDVFTNAGKDTGAFCSGAYTANPVVLLNYENTINSVFTLTHELGHAMHSYYSNKNQPYEKADYEIFIAEVASTVNEMLLLFYLLNNSKTKAQKSYYYNYLLKLFTSTIFRQTLFAEFEEYAHSAYENGEETTTDAFNDFYFALNKRYFGKNVEIVPATKYEWSRIPHFYTSFYVYKYATGLISAFYIATKIYEGDKTTLNNYLQFLSMGCTLNPVELLKIAGVNLLDKNTYKNVFNAISKFLDDWEKLN